MSLKVKQVETHQFVSREEFNRAISQNRRPLILRGVNIGPCTKKWTVEYLADQLGSDSVVVHVSPVETMSFIEKNFTYKTLLFKDFIQRAAGVRERKGTGNDEWFMCENECYYLRSIGADKRRKEVADISKQFPSISSDIILPDVFDPKDFFSSVFRIGSKGVQIWTHYDIMDNILIQVVGEKRVVLFNPQDTHYLYLSGDKSRVIDIDSPDLSSFPEFQKATRYECTLKSGDALYIPALWHHNTVARSFGIGVNVFWKNLPHDLYDKTDVYGNKDLVPAAKALKDICKAVQTLNTLPSSYKEFYLQRAISILEEAKNKD